MKKALKIATVVLLTISLGVQADTELASCQDCLSNLISGDDEPTFNASMSVETNLGDSTVIEFDTHLVGTTAEAQGTDTVFDAANEVFLDSGIDSLDIFVDGIHQQSLAMAFPAQYTGKALTVVTEPASNDTNACIGKSSFEHLYTTIEGSQSPANPSIDVKVDIEWKKFYDGDDIVDDQGTRPALFNNNTNPAVTNGTHNWSMEAGSNIKKYEVRYNISIDNDLVSESGWVKVNADSTCG